MAFEIANLSGSPQPLGTGSVPSFSGIIGSIPPPGTSRGFVLILGTLTGLNLNAVAATTIFTTPASGFTRCIITEINMTNSNGTPTTNAVSFGASATPTDWAAATVLGGGFVAGKGIEINQASNTPFAVYGTGVAFVANVTVGGAAITCDLQVLGYYN
jgi:hypothetical protein